MDILLTFAGSRDPYNPEIVKGVFTDGPVLTLLAERSFATVHIFTTPNTLPNAHNSSKKSPKEQTTAAPGSTISTSPIPQIMKPFFCT